MINKKYNYRDNRYFEGLVFGSKFFLNRTNRLSKPSSRDKYVLIGILDLKNSDDNNVIVRHIIEEEVFTVNLRSMNSTFSYDRYVLNFGDSRKITCNATFTSKIGMFDLFFDGCRNKPTHIFVYEKIK